jgi:hypothetical protein
LSAGASVKSSRRARAALYLACAVAGALALGPGSARAEKVLSSGDGWTVFTDGRADAFLSYVRGDAFPRNYVDFIRDPATGQPVLDANGNPTPVVVHDIRGGGFDALASRQPNPNIPGELTQGTIESMRVRSGFIPNVLGIGVRMTAYDVVVTAYLQFWAEIEADARQKGVLSFIDARQGYAKVEGRYGALVAGKQRALFSRGATDIDAMYAHRYGVGFPGNIDSTGRASPALGHIGFGVIGSGFASGMVYVTPPVLGGLQLTAGAFDPVQLQGAWQRTKWPRAEAELTFERTFGVRNRIAIFANGAYQTLYRPDSTDSTYAGGFGYGGRLELGPVHLGVAGHYGKGLGLNYALEVSDASLDLAGNQRKFDGYYVQSQFILSPKLDVSAGWGITRVFLIPTSCSITGTPPVMQCTGDNVTVQDPRFPTDPSAQVIPHSVIKDQMGISAAVVYHATPNLHFDLDGFRAEAAWFLGEKQVLYVVNAGMVVTW